MGFLGRLQPLSIEISTGQVTSIIADNDSIDVEHGHNFDDKIVPQVTSSLRVTQKIVDYILHHVTAHRLSRMHSRCYHHHFFLLAILSAISYNQIVASFLIKIYGLPDSVRHKGFLWNLCFLVGSLSSIFRYFISLV